MLLSPPKKPCTCYQSLPTPSSAHPLPTTNPPSASLICLYWTFHVNVIIHYVFFCDWHLSFSIFSSFIHIVPLSFGLFHFSFFWPNNIPLYGYTTVHLSVHQLMDIWVVSTFGPLWIMMLWIFMCKFLCEQIFLILLGIYLGVILLDHMITLYFTFWGTAKLRGLTLELGPTILSELCII